MQTPLVLSLLSTMAITNGAAVAGSLSLSFDALPSQQGWTFRNSPSMVESSYAAVDGLSLNLNSMGSGFTDSTVFWDISSGVVNPAQDYVLEVVAKVTGEESNDNRPSGFLFGVQTGTHYNVFRLGLNHIVLLQGGSLQDIPSDNSQFQTFKLVGSVDGQFEFYVDGKLISSGIGGNAGSSNRLILGDGGNNANGSGVVTSFVFTQAVPEPVTALSISFALAMLAANLGRHRIAALQIRKSRSKD